MAEQDCDLPNCVRLEIALGSDFDDPPNTWVWTDIALIGDEEDTYVLDQEITVKSGRDDWASLASPASVSFRVWDPAGNLSPSCNADMVRRTPLRVTACSDDLDAPSIRFCGHVDAINLEWPDGDVGNMECDFLGAAVVTISASGILARMSGGMPFKSPLHRWFAQSLQPTWIVWSLEEADLVAVNSTTGAPSKEQRPTFGPSGLTVFGYDSLVSVVGRVLPDLPGTEAVWKTSYQTHDRDGGGFYYGGPVTQITEPLMTPTWTVGVYVLVSDELIQETEEVGDHVSLWSLASSDDATDRFDFRLLNGNFTVRYNTGGGAADVTATVTTNPPSGWYWIEFSRLVSGTQTIVRTRHLETGASDFITVTWVPNAGQGMVIGPLEQSPDISAPGHYGWLVWRPNQPEPTWGLTAFPEASRAWVGELSYQRAERISDEEGVPLEACSGTGWDSTQPMGKQKPGPTYIEQIEDARKVAIGMLVERRDCEERLIFKTAGCLHGQTPVLNLRARQIPSELAPPFEIVVDAQGFANQVEVGQDDTGLTHVEPHGGASPPIYSLTETVNVASGNQLHPQASWRLTLASDSAPRAPDVKVDLIEAPHLADAVMAVEEGDIISIDELPSQWCGGTLLLMVQGITERIGPFTWEVTFNCSSGHPWVTIPLPANT